MFETLEGKNIVLRKARISDWESMLSVWSDKNIFEWMLFQPTYTKEDAIARCERSILFQKDHYAYFIALKSTDQAIGFCAIDEYEPRKFAECGIAISANFQGNGYGKEVISVLLSLVFENLHGESFRYGYFQNNIKSKKIAEHFGFLYECTGKLICPRDKKEKIIDYCILTKEKWEQKSRLK